MTRSRYRIFNTCYPYFMTCTVVDWLPVFTRPEAVEIVYDSWRYITAHRDFKLFGYVILENHLHLIASAPELSKVMQSFKSFTARQLLDLLKRRSATVLRLFREHKLRHKTDSVFQFWQEGNEPKEIQGDEMMWQKLEFPYRNLLECVKTA